MAIEKSDLHELKQDIKEYIRERCDAIDTRQLEANGRLRTAEGKIAVLEDRGSRDNTARATGVLSILGSIVNAIWK